MRVVDFQTDNGQHDLRNNAMHTHRRSLFNDFFYILEFDFRLCDFSFQKLEFDDQLRRKNFHKGKISDQYELCNTAVWSTFEM